MTALDKLPKVARIAVVATVAATFLSIGLACAIIAILAAKPEENLVKTPPDKVDVDPRTAKGIKVVRLPSNLTEEYRLHLASADEKFTGKVVEIISFGIDTRLTRSTKTGYAIYSMMPPGGIHLEVLLSKQSSSRMAKLQSGDKVSIRGKCAGMSGNFVTIRDGEILDD